MKKSRFYMLYGCILLLFLQTTNPAGAQNTKWKDYSIAQNAGNKPSVPERLYDLPVLLEQLEEKYDIEFLYRKDVIGNKKVQRVSHDGSNINKLLRKLLKGEQLSFEKLDEKHYAIFEQAVPPAVAVPVQLPATRLPAAHPVMMTKALTEMLFRKRLSVTGKVTDDQGQPLPGVSVTLKDTKKGTSTDANGNYTLENIPEDAVLVFSFLGYKTLEEPVNGRRQLNIVLQQDLQSLDEVIVVGYGTQKKSDLTGSVSSVKTEDLKGVPMTSIDQGLGGRASGVMVTQTSGMPGAVASIRIRGTSSLQGGNEPLYVIDGFPVYSGGGFGNTGGKTRLSGLATINPSDIESIEILKDASATAIYGARAANGVVLITTKSGKRGSDRITFDAYYGMQNVVKKIDVMNAQQYAELVNEAYENDGLAPIYDEEEMGEIRTLGEGTDWQDQLFSTAPTQNYQLTFSGGDEKTVYMVSGSYFDQDGVILNSDFKRYSGRINLERKLMDNFRAGTHLTINKSTSNAVRTDVGGRNGVVTGAMKFNPILPVREEGEYTLVNVPGIIMPNPVATAMEQVRENQTLRLLGNVYGEWEFLPDVTAKVSFGLDVFNNKVDQFTPSSIYEGRGNAQASIGNTMTYNWLNENTVTYSKEINDDHAVTVLGGLTFQRNINESFSASSQGFVNDVLEENALGAGAVYNQPGSGAMEWSIISFLGRINYRLMEKYLFSMNARMDGSSRFGKNNKYAFFPSVAFAWRLGEEDFVKDLHIFSDLKLRVTYGITGNQEIGLYNSLPTLGNTSYTFGRTMVTGFFPNKIPNPDLKWEKTAQFDVGADMGFFNNRLRLTADYYHKKTTDLIYSVAIPFVSGFGTSLQNIGSVQNQGLELAIESVNLDGAFTWTSNFNISFNRNKVLELGGETYKDVGSGDGHLKTGSVHRLIVGKPIGLFYGYRSDGIFQNQAEVDAGPSGPTNWIGGRRYLDISGPEGKPDGVVDATYDRTIIGNPNPDFFGGLTNSFGYKGFQLTAFLQYSQGSQLFNYNAIELESPTGGQNVYADLVNRWTPENPSNEYPKATTNRSAVFSDRYIEDGSYLKLKNLTLAYDFIDLRSNHLDGLRIYVSGQNLLTFTDYRGYDPEVSYRGATNLELGEDFGGYPQARTFLLGVTMNLK